MPSLNNTLDTIYSYQQETIEDMQQDWTISYEPEQNDRIQYIDHIHHNLEYTEFDYDAYLTNTRYSTTGTISEWQIVKTYTVKGNFQKVQDAINGVGPKILIDAQEYSEYLKYKEMLKNDVVPKKTKLIKKSIKNALDGMRL